MHFNVYSLKTYHNNIKIFMLKLSKHYYVLLHAETCFVNSLNYSVRAKFIYNWYPNIKNVNFEKNNNTLLNHNSLFVHNRIGYCSNGYNGPITILRHIVIG